MAGGDKITVLHPMGYPPRVTHKPLAPRLETLDGKTVYLVDCRFDDQPHACPREREARMVAIDIVCRRGSGSRSPLGI